MFIKNLGTWCETNDVALIFLTQRTAHSPFKKTVAYNMSSQLLNDFVGRVWLVHCETELSSSLQGFRTEWFSVKLNSCYSCEGKILSQSTNPGNATWKLIACQWNDSNLGKFKTKSCSQIKKSFKCRTPFFFCFEVSNSRLQDVISINQHLNLKKDIILNYHENLLT